MGKFYLINSFQCLKTAQHPPLPFSHVLIYTLIFRLTKKKKSYSYRPSAPKSIVRLKAADGNDLPKRQKRKSQSDNKMQLFGSGT